MLRPPHQIQVTAAGCSRSAQIDVRPYWKMNFPDSGQERDGDQKTLVDEFEQLMLSAVEKRLRADVPVGSYLSGGVDSSMIVALACHVKGPAINTYTVKVDHPDLDELDAASLVAKHVGTHPPIVQEFRPEDATNTYPQLIHAAEAPVVDTSCAALLQLAQKVHSNGQKVVLTGEGADEWLIGYPWYKLTKLASYLDVIPGFRGSEHLLRGVLRAGDIPQYSREFRHRIETAIGGPNAWIDSYGMLGLSKLRFYGESMRELLTTEHPWQELGMDTDRARKWDPINRGVWVASRVTLGGLLLQAKGDRVAMHNSVEVRYPFLDEEVFDFTASLHPKWKLKGLRDKHILRLLAERWVPPSVYKRGKVIFRAPLDSFHLEPEPPYIAELLSAESLEKTGYFDVEQVHHWRKAYQKLSTKSLARLSIEMGLAAVVATQLWHQHFIDSSIANVPSIQSA